MDEGVFPFCYVQLDDIFVKRKFQRLGIAKAMLMEVELYAQQQKDAKFVLSSFVMDNVQSVQFHLSQGFEYYVRVYCKKVICMDVGEK